MGKLNHNEQCRRDGMAFAYKIVSEAESKEKGSGLKALEDELRIRNILNHPIGLDMETYHRFMDCAKTQIFLIGLVNTLLTLHDEYDFGKDRMKRFIERYMFKYVCIVEDNATWDDYIQVLKEETGIDVTIDQKVHEFNISKAVYAGLKKVNNLIKEKEDKTVPARLKELEKKYLSSIRGL